MEYSAIFSLLLTQEYRVFIIGTLYIQINRVSAIEYHRKVQYAQSQFIMFLILFTAIFTQTRHTLCSIR